MFATVFLRIWLIIQQNEREIFSSKNVRRENKRKLDENENEKKKSEEKVFENNFENCSFSLLASSFIELSNSNQITQRWFERRKKGSFFDGITRGNNLPKGEVIISSSRSRGRYDRKTITLNIFKCFEKMTSLMLFFFKLIWTFEHID